MRWIWALLIGVVAAGGIAALWTGPAQVTAETDRGERVVRPAATTALPRPPAPESPAGLPSPSPTSVPLGRRPDGSMLVDGRLTVTGSGSEQDPLVISWPLLASAMETMDAAAGRLKPPPHIAFLNGQWVQISGFLAPPLWGEQTRELLVMKNRWDGCCIGLPPTPFDCIEAVLTEPVKLGARHSISFGTVRGRLVVEPFSAGSFLIGLYRLESAVNTTASAP